MAVDHRQNVEQLGRRQEIAGLAAEPRQAAGRLAPRPNSLRLNRAAPGPWSSREARFRQADARPGRTCEHACRRSGCRASSPGVSRCRAEVTYSSSSMGAAESSSRSGCLTGSSITRSRLSVGCVAHQAPSRRIRRSRGSRPQSTQEPSGLPAPVSANTRSPVALPLVGIVVPGPDGVAVGVGEIHAAAIGAPGEAVRER